jgi:hypothetical protein
MAMRTLMLILATVSLSACGSGTSHPTAPEPDQLAGALALKLAIPQALDIARISYQITGAGMDTLSGQLQLVGDSLAVATVTAIPPGAVRSFVLRAYDPLGNLTHSGNALAAVTAGETVEVRIQMRPASGQADVIGTFGDTDTGNPGDLQRPPPDHPLVGVWALDVAWLDTETLDFSYSFGVNGRFANRLGGAFLTPLQDLAELRNMDLGGLQQFDGGVLVLSGRWRTAGDSLSLEFDQISVELIGSPPLIGQVRVQIVDEALAADTAAMIGYRYAVSGQTLQLDGEELTLGVDLAHLADRVSLPAGISDAAGASLALVREFLAQQLDGEGLDRLTLSRRD